MNILQLRNLHRAATSRTNQFRESDTVRFYTDFRTALLEGELSHDEFSIADVFDHFVEDGHELRQKFNPNKRVNDSINMELLEDAAYVSTTAFTNITGQIVYSKVMENWNRPDFIGDQLVETIPTQFDGEKIPGVGLIGDKAAIVPEGKPYPMAGLAEQWVDTPQTIKRGLIVGVTKEAVFFDRTSLVLRNAGEVAETIRISKEKRILDGALGISTLYRRNGAAASATYGDSPFDNLAATNALVDYTDIENANLLFDGMTDPITGEPIMVSPDTLIYPTALDMTARRIVNGTHVEQGTYNGTPVTRSPNPLSGRYQFNLLTSPYVKNRTSSSTTWFIGQPKKAFAYMENWGVTVTQAPSNSEAEFSNDVVSRFKVSERGAFAVLEPRYMVKCTA